MNRRNFLGLTAGAMIGFGDLRFAEAQPSSSLKSCSRRPHFLTGVQATKQNLQVPGFVQTVIPNFNLLTPGLELKWQRLRPTPDAFRFTDAEYMVAFAESHGMQVHGHNLCWNASNPGWLQSTLTSQNAAGYLSSHISTVMKHFTGKIASWDVVNEPITDRSSRSDCLRPGIWLDLLGPEYIDIAFHAAAEADPAPLRILNLFAVEQDSPNTDRTRRATLSLLEGMLKRNVPIQAVGLESHLDGHNGRGPAGRNAFLAELEQLGLQILITELDVDDILLPADTTTRDRLVAGVYRDYLESIFASSKCRQVIFWTPWNGDSWLVTQAGHKRSDGLPARTGLWDTDFSATPSFAAACEALRSAQ